MKHLELRLISELMKNSRRSDRELAKALRVSQPTITRTRIRLEKEGYIKEYTMIPDFSKLGYQIMGITGIKVEQKPSMGFKDIRKSTLKAEENSPHAGLTIVNGIGNGKNRLFIDFYEDYSAYTKVIEALRTFPFINIESIDSFLVDLKDQTNLRVLSMALIAQHLAEKNQKKS